MRVRAHAAIWVGELLAVHKEQWRGELRVTLPGGRVNDRESPVLSHLLEISSGAAPRLWLGNLFDGKVREQ